MTSKTVSRSIRISSYKIKVVEALVKTKHKAVIAQTEDNPVTSCIRKVVSVYDRRQHNIDRLRYAIGTYDWTAVLRCTDTTDMYRKFQNALCDLIDQSIPKKTVRLGPSGKN